VGGSVEVVAVYSLGDAEPDIHPDAWVHDQATVIGNVHIGSGSTIWPHAVLRGDYGWISIGERTSIQDGAVLHCTRELPTVIGSDCVVGHLAHLECCTVEDGALIGTGSVVLHRVVVRRAALVGAAALVPNDMEVPSGAMALGVPAKLRLDAVDVADIARNAAEYVRNGQRYRDSLRRIS
jgi:carbonic anhydrase/acetyltransferase-like protein (isoleucine patch superfamily)